MALCTTTCDGKSMVAYTEPDCNNFVRLGNSTSIAYILCEDTNDLLKVNYAASGAWATAIAGVDSFKDLNVINNVLLHVQRVKISQLKTLQRVVFLT
jgi:hypothetical protein